MDKKEQSDQLIAMMVNYRSSFIGDEFPIKKLAMYLFKLNDNYIENVQNYKKLYETKTVEYITSQQFQNIKETLEKNIITLSNNISSYKISKESEEFKKKVFIQMTGISAFDRVFEKLMKKEIFEPGEENALHIFSKPIRDEIKSKLNELGKLITHQKVLEEAELSFLTKGNFEAKITFYSVPDACRWVINNKFEVFDEKNVNDLKKLKDYMKNYVRVYSKNRYLDWTDVNIGINSHFHSKNRESRTSKN